MEIGNLNEPMIAWFDFGSDARVQLLFLPKDELTRIVKRHTRNEFKRGVPREVTDDDKSNIELGRTVVKGWEGLTMAGKAFPFTPENCDLLMRKSYAFNNFVNERCVEVDEFLKVRDEDATKKSEPTPSGGQSQ